MREILFRGKCYDSFGWVYGNYVCVDNLHYIVDGDAYYRIEPNTIGQYTAMKDKNDVKIFEGDIVTQPVRETRKHSPCLVEFKDGKFQAHYISKSYYYDSYYDLNSYTKIIGNIHDNPELLGEQKDV